MIRIKTAPSDTLALVGRAYQKALRRWERLDRLRRSALYEIDRERYHDFERFCAECRLENVERKMARTSWDAITKPLWLRAFRLGVLVRVKARTASTDKWFLPAEVEFVASSKAARRHLRRNPPAPFVVWNPDTLIEEVRSEGMQTEYGYDHFETGFEFPKAHFSPQSWGWVATYGDRQEKFYALEAARAWVDAQAALAFSFHSVGL
jgi:hypothetical protein